MEQGKGVVVAACGLVLGLVMGLMVIVTVAVDSDECKPGDGTSTSQSDYGSSPAIPSAEGTVKPMKAGTYQLTSPFGNRGGEMHKGQDLAGSAGTPIYAFADGVVRYAGTATGFGHWIVLDHNIKGKGKVSTVYGHMYADGLLVKPGQTVKAGQLIAREGNDGVSTGPHLHFEVHPGGYSGPQTAVDPAPWLAAAGEPGGQPAAPAPTDPGAGAGATPLPVAQQVTTTGGFSKNTTGNEVDRTGGITGGHVSFGNISGTGITTAGQQRSWDIVRQKFPTVTLISATRIEQVLGRPDNHNRGIAIDIGGDLAKLPEVAETLAQMYPDSRELIWGVPPFNKNISMGKPFNFDQGTLNDHKDHVHWTAPDRVLDGSAPGPTPGASTPTDGAGKCAPGSGDNTLGGGVDNLAPGKVPAEYEPWLRKAGVMCPQISSALLAGDQKQESKFNRMARSTSGADGPAQFMPGTWAAYGRDDDGNGVISPNDIGDATMAQGRYFCAIAKQIDGWIDSGRVKPDSDGRVGLYVAAYNAGEGAILNAGGMPSGGDYTTQTRPYVKAVLGYAREFAAAGFDGKGL